MNYKNIVGKTQRTVRINEKVEVDATRFADKKALSFSQYVEEALIDKIESDREQLNEPEPSQEMIDRAIKQVLLENEAEQSGVFSSKSLDEAKEDTLNENR